MKRKRIVVLVGPDEQGLSEQMVSAITAQQTKLEHVRQNWFTIIRPGTFPINLVASDVVVESVDACDSNQLLGRPHGQRGRIVFMASTVDLVASIAVHLAAFGK